MVARLADLELLGVVHGDISASGLALQPAGNVVLPMPGLRGIVRPAEGYAFADLPPEAYDYLAPERIEEGSPPTLASDVYACGCLWWHLLTGRPPFAGGNTLTKLKAVHAARWVDVRQLALDVPDALARAIELCIAHDPAARPASSIAARRDAGATGTRRSCDPFALPGRASLVVAASQPAEKIASREAGAHAGGSRRRRAGMCGCRRPVGRPAASQSTAAVACGGVDRCENLHG